MTSRTDVLSLAIRDTLEEVSGQTITAGDPRATFVEQGFDSLILTQVALALSKKTGVPIKLRHLVEQFPNTAALAAHLDSVVAPDKFRAAATPAPAAAPPAPASTPADEPVFSFAAAPPAVTRVVPTMVGAISNDPLESLIQQQLVLMSRQLDLLAGVPVHTNVVPVQEYRAPATAAPSQLAPSASPAEIPAAAARTPALPPAEPEVTNHRYGPQLVIKKEQAAKPELSARGRAFVDETLAAYLAKTKASKAFTARNRPTVADPRTVAGFSARLKETVYPIVAKRSEGCRIWDVDDNEYVDTLSGYGSNFFGFGAPFIQRAIAEQMSIGMEIGPQTHLVEEVTNLFLEFVPHFDRVAYCNTGSEAVLATFRLARTVVGRDLIVMFEGGYHGMFDEVVARPTKKRTMPAAPGIPGGAVENLLILPWADPLSLQIIAERADEIAGVIVEPVQSRAPHVQPGEFLRELRALTTKIGAALIFDEVVCGFRVAPGGGQAHFGIQADLATYGKVVGGGISIGIVAGKREFMDALDGGAWQFGDDSVPEVGVTYFAGTFVRHPLALAAARAALRYMKEQGPGLQERVSRAGDDFAARVNAHARSVGAPFEVRNFGSVLNFTLTAHPPYSELLFHQMRLRGVHIWDGRPGFLTMAHGAREVDFLVSAFQSSIDAMCDGELFERTESVLDLDANRPPVLGAKIGRDPSGNPAWFIPDPAGPARYRQL